VGIKIDKLIGLVLVLIGVSMLLIAADLAFVAEVDWTVRAIADVSLLAAMGVTAIVFGCKRLLAHHA
jgi:hypothetical protein